MAQRSKTTARPRRLPLILPFAGFCILAAMWSVYWFAARDSALAELAAFRQTEAARGRTLTCAEERYGGFPFRFEIRCTDPVIEIARTGLRIELSGLTGVALAYQPKRLIAELAGPARVTGGGVGKADIAWSLLQSSMSLTGLASGRFSAIADDPVFTITAPTGQIIAGRADRLAFHVRTPDKMTTLPPAYDVDVAVQADALFANGADAPWTGRLAATITGIVPTAGDATVFWRAFQAAGGRLSLTDLHLTDGNAILTAKGGLGLGETGRPDGALVVGMATRNPPGARDTATPTAQYLALLTMAGGLFGRDGQIDGLAGREVDLILDNGAIRLGTMTIGAVPRLF